MFSAMLAINSRVFSQISGHVQEFSGHTLNFRTFQDKSKDFRTMPRPEIILYGTYAPE